MVKITYCILICDKKDACKLAYKLIKEDIDFCYYNQNIRINMKDFGKVGFSKLNLIKHIKFVIQG